MISPASYLLFYTAIDDLHTLPPLGWASGKEFCPLYNAAVMGLLDLLYLDDDFSVIVGRQFCPYISELIIYIKII